LERKILIPLRGLPTLLPVWRKISSNNSKEFVKKIVITVEKPLKTGNSYNVHLKGQSHENHVLTNDKKWLIRVEIRTATGF